MDLELLEKIETTIDLEELAGDWRSPAKR